MAASGGHWAKGKFHTKGRWTERKKRVQANLDAKKATAKSNKATAKKEAANPDLPGNKGGAKAPALGPG